MRRECAQLYSYHYFSLGISLGNRCTYIHKCKCACKVYRCMIWRCLVEPLTLKLTTWKSRVINLFHCECRVNHLPLAGTTIACNSTSASKSANYYLSVWGTMWLIDNSTVVTNNENIHVQWRVIGHNTLLEFTHSYPLLTLGSRFPGCNVHAKQ